MYKTDVLTAVTYLGRGGQGGEGNVSPKWRGEGVKITKRRAGKGG